jgi:hypothetical protein
VTTLATEWAELLARRPAFESTLAPLGPVFEAWQSWSNAQFAPLRCTAEQARLSWSRGEPLLATATPSIPADIVEPLLHPALDVLAGLENTGDFIRAWDDGGIGPASLLPSDGRLGASALPEQCHLTQAAVAFLAVAGLRPVLSAYFSSCRSFVDDGLWDAGMCPCCGSPPGFADLVEDGRRQLVCHVCDTRWTFARLACPLCANRVSDELIRLIAEGADEGYAISVCRACRGYIKEIDRRARWNAGSSIVEDWGTPHIDLIAHRQHYWRPVPTLIQLTDSQSPDIVQTR